MSRVDPLQLRLCIKYIVKENYLKVTKVIFLFQDSLSFLLCTLIRRKISGSLTITVNGQDRLHLGSTILHVVIKHKGNLKRGNQKDQGRGE